MFSAKFGRTVVLTLFFAGVLTSCSSSGKFFVRNNTGAELRLYIDINGRFEVIPHGGVSKKYRNSQTSPLLAIEVGECSFHYNAEDFRRRIIREGGNGAKNLRPILIEYSIQNDGMVKSYQINSKDKSRAFEWKRVGGPIKPQSSC